MSATFDFGNRSVTASITGRSAWEKEGMSRTYFTLAFDGAKGEPIAKLYEVHAGGTRDESFQIAGRTFAFQPGFADSKTKRRAIAEAARSLAAEVVA